MRIKSKDVLRKAQMTPGKPAVQMQTEQPAVQRQEAIPNDNGNFTEPPQGKSKLEADFRSGMYKDPNTGEEKEISYGDRMRVLDSNNNMHDVILMPDGQVAIQDLTLRVTYGNTKKYSTWEEAEKAIGSYTLEKHMKV